MTIQREELFDHLDALGGTAEIVARTLLDEGCFGVVRDCGECPIAIYASRLLGYEVDVVAVDHPKLARVETVGGDKICDLPPACQRFASEFDGYHYSELIKV